MKLPRLVFLCAVLISLGNVHATNKRHSEWVRSRIPRELVKSSGIAAVGYSKRMQILEIEFVNGAVYRYEAVPIPIYQRLLASDSKGRFYQLFIRGKYRSVHVKVRESDSG